MSLALSGVLHGAVVAPPRATNRGSQLAPFTMHVVAVRILLYIRVLVGNERAHSTLGPPGHLLARIGGMGTLGGLCAGLMRREWLPGSHQSAGVLVLSILHLACARSAVAHVSSDDVSRRRHRPVRPPRPQESTVLEAVSALPILIQVGKLVLAASVAALAVDFVVQPRRMRNWKRSAPLVRFFRAYYIGHEHFSSSGTDIHYPVLAPERQVCGNPPACTLCERRWAPRRSILPGFKIPALFVDGDLSGIALPLSLRIVLHRGGVRRRSAQ